MPEFSAPWHAFKIQVVGDRGDHLADRVRAAVDAFSTPDLSRLAAWSAIAEATAVILEADWPTRDKNVALVPVLRAGLAMLDVARLHFLGPSIWPALTSRSEIAAGIQPTLLRQPDSEPCAVIVLDPIVATGGTLMSMLAQLQACEAQSIDVICCYGAPSTLVRVAEAFPTVSIHVGVLARSVDTQGYLQPSTHGDAGDKLFR